MFKNHPYYGKSMSTNFPGSPHTKGFVAFSRTMRNWWGNPCISQMTKYAIRWESSEKKAPKLWEKYEYQFLRHSPYHGFCCIFPYCGKFMGKPMHFPYAEVYHRMGIGWEKSTHTMGKVSLLNRVLGVLACSRTWRAYVLACSSAWLTCFLWCLLGVFTINLLTFLSNYLFCLHKSRLCN